VAAVAVLALLLRPSSEGPETDAGDDRLAPVVAPAPASATAALDAPPTDARAHRAPSPSTAPIAPEEPTRDLAVTVRTARGLPVEGATAFLEDTAPVEQGALTDASGLARLRAPTPDGWVLVRTREGVWERAAFTITTPEGGIGVVIPDEPVLRGRVRDAWERPAGGIRLRILCVGHENPARAWPGVRRWEMRSEVGEVVTDSSGAFELRGLPDRAGGFAVESPDGDVRGFRGGPTWIFVGPSNLILVGRYVRVLVDARDALTEEPVRRARIVAAPDSGVGGLHVEDLVVEWARPSGGEAPPVRVEIHAPGFESQVVTIEPPVDFDVELATPSLALREPRVGGDLHRAQVVRMTRGSGRRASAIRVKMPPGVHSLLRRVPTDLSWRGEGRGSRSTGYAFNRGAYWEFEGAGGAGQWLLSNILGLGPTEPVTGIPGEVVELDPVGPPWGRVALRLTADADLCRGEFQAEARTSARGTPQFRVTADAQGRADAGWWPPGPRKFYVSRSAEAGESATVEVRPGPEPTVVEIPIRNLLTR
jgi:hypothetical protein